MGPWGSEIPHTWRTRGRRCCDIRGIFVKPVRQHQGEPLPELPDISAYLCALDTRILGRTLTKVRVLSAFVLRTADPPITDVEDRTVRELRRIGKRVALGFDNDVWVVIHLMIAGRFHWRAPGTKLAGRNNLAAFDFAEGSLVLTEAGTKRRASIHVVSGEAAVRAIDPGGIDVFACSAEQFRLALTAENRTLKRALTDPRIVSGIGNAYSDEILHAARLSPIALTRKLSPQEWERLFVATRDTLDLWMGRLCQEAGGKFPDKVTAFRPEMAVHGRFNLPCPRCGATVQRIRYADNETNYCPVCQTGGKLLADRALSRLLGADWPRSLDELELLKRL
jgi:formamidopyrimidine-DNA glycosylase